MTKEAALAEIEQLTADLKNKTRDCKLLAAEMLRDWFKVAALDKKTRECERLQAENTRLRAENTRLAKAEAIYRNTIEVIGSQEHSDNHSECRVCEEVDKALAITPSPSV